MSKLVMRLLPLLLAAVLPAFSATDSYGSKPHIVVLLADNVGWANVGFHRPPEEPFRELYSPHIDALAANGLKLDRHYTYKFCSPSRSSFLTGRLPVHVNTYNDDPTRPGAGVPTNMTIIAQRLREVGYRSHMVGKWHVGMAREANTPQGKAFIPIPHRTVCSALLTPTPTAGKGFASSLNYFHSMNNYYNSRRAEGCGDHPATDLWDTDRPARELNGTGYEER